MVVRWKVAMMQFDFDVKQISGITNVVADLLSRLVKNHMETQIVEDTVKELLDLPPKAVHKAVDEVVLTLLYHHELLPYEIYLKIKRVHNSVVGHGGLEMTMSRLAQQGQAWKYMRAHVKFFIKQCACCQKMSSLKISIQAHHFVTSSYTPMSLLNIDFIGPFNTEEGSGYILTIICCFTRRIVLFVVDNLIAK